MADDNAKRLEEIRTAIKNLTQSPLYEFRQENQYEPVIGEGNPSASIVIIGEAPGKQEAKSGRPFVGASGRVLDELLAGIGVAREDVYITNVVKDRPPENRDPRPEEIELYAPFLTQQLEIIQPRVVVTLGRFAMDFMIGNLGLDVDQPKISQLHGQVLWAEASYGKVALVPLYHPAVALYSTNQKETLVEDFEILRQFLE